MKDEEKTRDQLIIELVELRKYVTRLKTLEAELERTEEARKELEGKYSALVKNSPDIIYILDPEGYIRFVAGPLESLLGFTAEELEGKHYSSLICNDDVPKAEWHFNERRIGERSTKGFEVRLRTKKGNNNDFDTKYLPVELHAVGVYDRPISAKERRFLGTYGVARNITKQKWAEEQLETTGRELQDTRAMLAQAEKLAAIGRLTAGVAHEILNPINIISMRMQLLNSTEDLSDRTRNTLGTCRNQLNRIIEITRNLGQFSAIHKQHTTKGELNKVIEHVLTLWAPQFKEEGIKTDVHYHPDMPLIPLEKERIEQVIFNIISNAAAAMAGQETKMLHITTKPANSKDYVQIIISDMGPGIKHSDIDKIFDPFFTTKDLGQGTGLGLFISYSIIKDHGGRIWAENNEWGGASFLIELPVVREMNSQRPLERRMEH